MAGAGSDPPPPRLLSIPKEGERVIAPTRRPDGTLRKPIRIRAGYVPQDEVAIYQSKGALLMKESQPQVSPGYDPALAEKPKTKSSKRNERKKEKRHQPALEKEQNLELEQSDVKKAEDVASSDNMTQREEPMEAVIEQMCTISVSTASEVVTGTTDTVEIPKPKSSGMDLDEKIRALKKKIRLTEVQLQDKQQNLTSEQLEKMRKVEGWREELTLLEDQKIRLAEVQLQDKQQNLTSEQLEKMRKVEGWREELTLLEDQKANLVL